MPKVQKNSDSFVAIVSERKFRNGIASIYFEFSHVIVKTYL